MSELTDRISLIKYLKEKGIWLDKMYGQHFLINQGVLDKITGAANLNKEDKVIEVGAGLGVLTEELGAKSARVVSFEVDNQIAELLKKRVGHLPNVEIVVGDFLKEKIPFEKDFKVVANLPYSITTPLIRRFFEQGPAPKMMVLLLQKEVAERLASQPGDSNRGWVSVLVQFWGNTEVIFKVGPENFMPPPKVESAVLVVDDIKKPDVDMDKLIRIVKAGFSAKRRQLGNSLAGGLGISVSEAKGKLKEAGIDEKLRAEDLTNEQWKAIVKVLG